MLLKKDLIDKQARFWVLMAGGATLTGASETVGVSRATGRKWRQATGGRIPRKRPEPSGRYLSLEERLQIADLYLGGAGIRAIAVGIGRSPATVSRELRRNGSAPTPRRLGKYAAQKQAELIVGSNCRSAIATLVERQTRYVMLVHLPDDHSATAVRDGLLATIKTLPDHLRKSLTWDQGTELTRHAEITLATKMDIYFCDPHSPWQRGSNENTVSVGGAAFGLIGQAGCRQ